MDILSELKDFKTKFDPLLEDHLDKVVRETRKEDRLMAEAVGRASDIILAGGKRLRPALMCVGYRAAGGRDEEKILRASMSIELVHAFLLIHDDIIDRDPLRHGKETIHSYYSRVGRRMFPKADSEHFGNSMAIILGDMIAALGNDIIFRSEFPLPRVFRALSELQKIVSYTVIGQAMDIALEYRGKATKPEILRMYEYKTAKYTMEGPLMLGALLAGASDEFLAKLTGYAIPVGIAFQIRDDILGVFGAQEKTGKPIGSDLEEGKRTILTAFALERSSVTGRRRIESLLRKGSATKADLEEFRKIMRETGALNRSVRHMTRLVEKGKRHVEESDMSGDAKEFLLAVADYIAERNF